MKVVIYSVSPLLAHAFGVLMDEAEIYLRRGYEVNFVYCDGVLKRCSANLFGSRLVCSHCKMLNKLFLGRRSKSIKKIPLSCFCKDSYTVSNKWKYDNVAAIKEIRYKDAEIGYSCLSVYIDKTRNLDPLVNTSFTRFFDCLLDSAKIAVDVLNDLIVALKPNIVMSFNARQFDNNPLLTITKRLSIEYNCVELYLSDENGVRYKEYYGNNLPHNYQKWRDNIYDAWERSRLTDEEKTKIGCNFFYRRRNKEYTGDVSIYIEDQQKGLLPENIDFRKCNIAFFNSSEDELAALGKDFSSKNVFSSQLNGIKSILQQFQFNEEVHFYLRIHPNLANIRYSYHSDLLNLGKDFSNITIIPSTSLIDSYALMEAVNKVIVFSSSMGVESLFWGKPVIVLGNTFYYALEGLYKPTNPDECYSYVAKEIKPTSRLDAIKYGYYLMYKDDDRKYKYVNFNSSNYSLCGRALPSAKYQTLFSSNLFFFSVNAVVILFSRFINKLKNRIIPK